ncbi:MAG: inositol monophosphatase [Bacteroidia bacterium]|nr:inositol monophosphatase [Bacteroidia bacterium]
MVYTCCLIETMERTQAIVDILKEAKSTFFDASVDRFDSLDIKGLNQLVTDIDVATEKFLVSRFKDVLPTSSFIAEENTGVQTDAEYQWIIDPLDGTTNFVHQIPVYSISVALQRNGKTIEGYVYELNRDELFRANAEGAWLNDTPIQVTETTEIADTLLATGFPYYDFEKVPEYLKVLEYCMRKTRGVRRLGSAAVDLAYVACGRFDGFFEVGLSPWDVAAGAYIVQQAGGKVIDFSGGDQFIFGGEIVAGNPAMAQHLQEIIQHHFES